MVIALNIFNCTSSTAYRHVAIATYYNFRWRLYHLYYIVHLEERQIGRSPPRVTLVNTRFAMP